MEHKIKRFFAFLLSMLMLLNSVPVNAFATEVHEHDHEAEVMAVADTGEHVHSVTLVEAKEASCTENGNIAYFSCECGKFFYDQEATAEIPAESVVIAAGHSWDEGTVTAPATETAEGVMTYTCSCGETKTEAIPMLVHTHSWDEGVITTPATETAEGVMTYTCSCGETKTETIAMLAHTHSLTKAEDGEYWICGCGSKFADEAGTTAYTETVEPADECAHTLTAVEAKEATCTEEGNSAYWSCAECGKFFSDEGVTEIEENSWIVAAGHTMKYMEEVNASCTVPGTAEYWFCTACGEFFADEAGNEPMDYVAHKEHAFSGYTWDFSQGSASSTNGGNSLKLVKTGISDVTSVDDLLKDGELVASSQTTMTLANAVTLNSSEDWTVELVAKGYEGVTMRSFLSTNVAIGSAVYVYITGGDLSLVKSAGYTADSGTTIAKTYTYYKVSDADYAASPMGRGTFDQTQYHTYQLRCVDGVLSYWLDGQKIGNLALSEQTGGRDTNRTDKYTSGNGCAFASSLKTLKFTHVGCGSSKNATSQAITADIKYLGIYSGHTYSGDCDASCDNEGCDETRTVSTGHTWDDGVVTKEATATEEGILTYTCTVCGATETEVIPVSSCSHEMTHVEAAAPGCTTPGNSEYWSCSKCGKYFADVAGVTSIEKDSWVIAATNHSMTKTDAVAATCTAAGNVEYWTCGTCGLFYADEAGENQIEKDSWILSAKGHGEYVITNPEASCTTTGGTLKQCPDCGSSYYDTVTPGLSGYVWDFSRGSAASLDGSNTLTLTAAKKNDGSARPNGTVAFADGVMKANVVTMEMDKTVELNAQDGWAFEIVLKTDSASTSPKVVLAENNMLSSGTSLFLYGNGDLYLAKKGTVKDSNTYWYFKVSDADFDANMPADFDITEYHTYRMEANDGVFSYWLDGNKIGDLSVTSNNQARVATATVHEGQYLKYDTITAKYIGNGNSGSLQTFGFTGNVKSLAVYPGHTYTNACDPSCNNEGCTVTREAGHTMTGYEAKPASCTENGNLAYWSCSVCEKFFSNAEGTNEIADKTSVVIPAAHTYSGDCDEICDIEGCGFRREAAAAHSYNAVKTEATFEADAYTTYTCSACGDSYVETEEGSRLTAVAVIGEKKFTTLEAAIAAAVSGDTITVQQDVTVSAPVVAGSGVTIDFNGKTVSGTVLGRLMLNGGTLVTAEGYRMAGPEADYYITTDAVLTMDAVFGHITVESGTMTLAQNWWTGETQTLTIGKDATFIIPEGMKLNVLSTVVIEGTVEINGEVNLYSVNATVKAAEGLQNITTTAGDMVVYVDGKYIVHKHNLVYSQAKEESCTEAGNTEYWSCDDCGKFFSDAEAKNEIAENSWIIPAAHKLTYVAAKETSCQAPGNVEYWNCSVCRKNYADNKGDTEIEDVVIAQLAHRYGEPTFAWADDNLSCQVSYTCSVGNETVTEDGTVTIETTDADCVLPGTIVYTATIVVDGETYTDRKTISGQPVGHQYGEAVFVWDGITAAASVTCSACAEGTEGHVLSGTAAVQQTGTTAGDCQTNSTTTYRATITLNNKVYTEDKTFEGELGSHAMTRTGAVASTCIAAGHNAYYTCSICDKVYKDEAGMTETTVQAETLPLAAHTLTHVAAKAESCTEDGNTEYWSCSVCEKFYSDADAKTEITDKNSVAIPAAHKLTHEAAKEATCAIPGNVEHWNCSECGKNFSDEAATTELDVVLIPVIEDDIWDFSTGSATTGNGNTLTVVDSSTNGTMSVADGVMNANSVVMKLGKGIKLTADKKWAFEITMKAHTNADGVVVTPKTVLAENSAYSSGNSIYLNNQGGLTLLKKATIEGVKDYWYYRVPTDVFAANMPADFDITQYHTYRLECEGDTFSFWLDGQKIGNLGEYGALNEKDAAGKLYVFTGDYLDFSSFNASYIGNGSSKSTNAFGLTGDVKSMSIYHAHSYTNTCDTTCDNEGCTHTRVTSHVWNEGEITTSPSSNVDGVMTYTCTVCGETKTEAIPAYGKITMKYDDRLAVSDLGQTGEPVITTKTVTSKKVGTTTADDAVVVYVDGKLIATGVGTAEAAFANGEVYQITVEPATISMLMVTGHSLGSGSKGDKDQSIICEEGQVYSTNELAYSFKLCTGSSANQTVEGIDVTGMGLGYGSEKRPTKINLLNASGTGVQGMDSGLGYRWAQLTGEKVWILNSAKGSTSLETWQEGGYNYRHAVTLFTTAQEIMYNEVQAGHYILNKMGIVNYTTANGDQTWSPEKYTEAFNSMWNGFKREMAVYDFDGDGKKDTVDCIGLLPLWNPCSINNWDNLTAEPLAFYTAAGLPYYGKLINYSMSYFEDEGVMMASDAGRSWLTDANVTAYFQENPVEEMYGTLQNGTTHTSPTTVQNGVYGDGVHYCQLGYNVQGVDTANSMYEYWYGLNDVDSVKLLQANGVDKVPAAIEIPVEGTYVVVPDVDPTSAKLSYTLTGDAVSYDSCILTGESVGTATLTILDQDGETLKTVDITVREKTDEDLADTVWYEWDFSKGSATNTAGVTTDNTLTLVKSADSTVTSVEDMLKDGVLNASKNTTMKLTNSVILDPAKNWAIEITAKGDGTNAIRSFASTTVTLSGYYIYISPNGDLSIVHKGSFTADDGTAVTSDYTYYKVSNADYEASVLNTDAFDITQYHTYQLRCENGVFAFWLDGEKIGDLALSEASGGRGDSAKEYTAGSGTPFGRNTMTITHVGCGSSSNASSQGLMATVKSLKFFSDTGKLTLQVGLDAVAPIAPMMVFPGDEVTLPKPDTGDYCAKFLGWSTEQDGTAEYKAGDTYTVTGFAPVSLYAVWEAFESSDGVHVFVDGVCTNCGAKKAHKMTAIAAKDATCYADGNTAYWTCSECGKYFSDAEGSNEIQKDSWIVAGGHQMTEHKAAEASCSGDGNTAYWSCSRCGKFYADAEGEQEIAENSWIIPGGHKLTHVEAKKATCVAPGNVEYWNCSVCKKNFSDEAATKELASVETAVLTDTVWDFTTGSAVANTGNELTQMPGSTKRLNGTVAFANGVMTGSTVTMKMSNAVKLTVDEDWTVEAVLKTSDASTAPKTLLAESDMFSQGTSIYLGAEGNLILAQRGKVNSTSNAYWYFMVSDEDFDANMPADFDITQYHTYRMEYSGGKYSYWLDGEKIGDLAITSNSMGRNGSTEYDGQYLDYSTINARYIGSGNSGSLKTFGFSGDLKSLAIYVAHSYDNSCDTTCNNEGCAHVRETSHVWNHGEITKYPTETEVGERKYTCTVCGEIKTEEIPVSEHIHIMTATKAVEAGCETAGNSAYWYCDRCDKYFSDEYGNTEIEKDSWITEATGHSWNAGEVTTEPSATNEGVKTYSCSGCTETKTEVIPATDYAWDFEKGEAISTFGTNTISVVENSKNGTMSVADGIMTVNTATMELAHGVKMTAADKWAFEITMKAHTNDSGAVITPKTVLAENKAYSSGSSIYINNVGSMTLLKKATIEDVNDYWYYRVPMETFQANMPADFDMTEYHTYRLECDGERYSFWLDGEKIGELGEYISLNKKDSNGNLWVHQGEYLSFSSITAKYVGNGSSKDIKAFGFTGDVDQMRIITGDKAITHAHTMTATEAKDATCTEAGNSAYWYCSSCDKYFSDAKGKTEIAKDSWIIGAKGHTMTTTEAVKVSCEADGNSAYWYCSVCDKYFSDVNGSNEIEKDSWIIPATGHAWNAGVVTKEPTETETGIRTFTCGNCGGTRTEIIPMVGHVHKLVKTEPNAATCNEPGNTAYWTCSGCGLYFADENGAVTIEKDSWIIAAKGHTMTGTEAKEATCTESGNSAYWSCSECGKFFSDEKGTTEIAKDSWIIAAKGHTMTGTEAKEATCEAEGNSAYWYCSECDKYFSDEKGSTEIAKDSWILTKLSHSLTHVVAQESTCAVGGNVEHWHCTSCGKNFSDEAGTKELETVSTGATLTDTVWDFSTGTATSGNGNELSFVSSYGSAGDTEIVLADGTLVAGRTTMKMSKGVTLDEAKDWTVEITVKGHNDAIKTVFSTGYAYASSKFIYINGAGDLMLGCKGTFIADDGTEVSGYSYYKVSNADFEANMPAGFDINEYHTYQLRCEDGVFSYWLDGEKIGNLAMTEQSTSRSDSAKEYTSGSGTPFNFSKMTMNYVGNGNNSKNSQYGLTGTVKSMGIYPAHSFDNACDATCNNAGCTFTRTTEHDWGVGEIVKYPTQTEPGERKFTCSGCGETKSEEIPVDEHFHSMTYVESADPTCASAGNVAHWRCSGCGKNFADENGTRELESVITDEALVDYIWDFSQGVPTSTNGGRTFSYVTTHNSGGELTNNGTMEFADGVMHLANKTALQLNEGIRLNAEHDWAFEITMSTTATGKNLLASGKGIAGSAIAIHLTASGSLGLMAQVKVNGVQDYSYYTVSDEDFQANMPENFSVEDYHTYRLECNDGIFSFHLDGKKIGDLSVTKAVNSKFPVAEGAHKDFSDFTVKYMSSGINGNVLFYGVSGDIKSMGVYPAHNFDNACDTTCNNDGCTYTRTTEHDWDIGEIIKYPTETESGERKFTCSDCGETRSEVIPAGEHIHRLTKVEAVEDSCAGAGNVEYWNCSGCGKNFADENGVKELESVETANTLADNIWDFSTGTAISGNGNELTLIKSADAAVTDMSALLKDGTLAALSNTTMQMSKPVTLKSSEDWMVELVAQGVAGSAIRSFMSTSSALSGVYFYINDKGDLSIVKKGAFTADDGTAVSSGYTYYKVSDEDYNMSILASGKFDFAQMHSYQLRCEDGVFSFWLDNEKIGNLALSEQTGARSLTSKKYTAGSGTPFDFSNLRMAFVGCGSSSNAASQGLKATVKELGIYPGHSYDNSCDATCNNAGCTHVREVNHSWNYGEITKAPTETTEGERTYTCTVCGATRTEIVPELGKIVMEYDDRLRITDLGQKGAPDSIVSNVTSNKIGTDTPDDAVLAYVDGKLIAVGVGTAAVTWGTGSNAVTYNITVEPATISMLMVTGHSLGSGSQGTTSKSIVCEDGEIYCTNERAYAWKITSGSTANETVEGIDVTGMGLGYGSERRPKNIDALNESGAGTNGVDSGIAYNWAKLTGEKVWILNSAKGSTHLGTWQKGGFNYRHAVELFTTAQEIMYNEVQAGHYKLNKMGIVNFTTANGDQTWPAEQYTKAFNSMWEGFQEQMRVYDFDGDGTTDTVDCISLLPLWNVCSMKQWDNLHKEPLAFFTTAGTKYYGKLINYFMSAFGDNGVILGSSVMRQWTSDADVAAYFQANPIENMYGKLQDGTTDKNPTTVRNGVYGDGVHYGQLGYNVLGIDIAKNMYDYWYGKNDLVSLRLLQGNGVTEVPDAIEVRVGEEYVVAPDAVPASAKLAYSVSSSCIAYENGMVIGVKEGEAVLSIKDLKGNVLKTVNITILPALEEEQEEVVWYAWDFAQGSATNTSGSSLDNTLSLVMSADSEVIEMTDILKDGTLAATQSTTMALSKPVTLDASRNWAVELVAKGEEGVNIRSFMSTDVTMNGTYFNIDANGDLSIVKKGAFTADDGSAISSGYTYYKVSDDDFEASVLASGEFDISEYHSYQLRCTNGVFSYWLDGEKIGDLTLSEQTTVRGDSTREYTRNTGTPFDFSELVMTHIGCGSNTNAASQGLTATVQKLNIYTSSGKLNLDVGLDAIARLEPLYAFPGENLVLPRPNNGEYCAKFLGWAENQDGSGKLYQAGDTYAVTGFEPTTVYGIWQAYETSDGVHTYENGVCTSCGVADADFYPWDIWYFDDGTTVSDDGVTTISRITTNHNGSAVTNNGTMSVSSGAMHVNNAALELSSSIKLTADKDWTVDFTMKALVDKNGEVVVPKTLLAENKLFSNGTSFYLTATGDMLIAQKGTVGGSNTYWYFKVSDADFENNMPARFDITKYHTYRIANTDGVLSYWLDGVKIGDFALTSDSMGRGGTVHNGKKLDYSDLDMRYIGNGNSSNCKTFGFSGDVDQIGIFTDGGTLAYVPQHEKAAGIAAKPIYPGEKVVLPKPDTGDYCVVFRGWTVNADGSGTLYPAGSTYSVNGVESVTLYGNWEERTDGTTHSFGNKPVITDPTCATEGYSTYTCKYCGHEKITNIVEKSTHSFTAEVVNKEYACTKPTYDTAASYYRSCIVCGLSSQGTGGESTFTSGRPGDGYYSVVSKQDWDTAPGITESEMILNNSTGERRQAVHVMQVDISDPYASILPSYMGMNPTPGNFKLGTMSQHAGWVEQNMGLNVVGGMNTCLSWYDSAYYDEHPDRKNEPLGILVINGELYAQNTSARTCLVVNYDQKNGVNRPAGIPKVEMRYTSEGTTGWEEQVVSCNFEFIVKDGVNQIKPSHANQSSKSVLGIKADGTIVIMQNDGELAPYSNGMSVYEIAETMITLGCVDAVRCDGGGTSTYLSQRPGEELKVNNVPADGAERPTTGGILVISSAPSTGEFMRATLSTDDTYYTPGSKVPFHAVGTDLVGTKVDVPKDAVWQIKEQGMGTIKDGLFVSNGKEGKVTVQLVYNDKIVGEHAIEIVIPETFQFRQPVITVPYGKTVEVVLTATINNGLNTVTLNPDDIAFTTDNPALGSFNGTSFAAVAEKDAPENQNSNITATLKSAGLTAKAKLNLGKASVVIDDFEDGIDRWNMRPVTSRPVCDYEFIESNADNGYVHSGNKAVGMIMDNHSHMQEAGYYAQFMLDLSKPMTLENANSFGAWVYVPDDFYNLWIRMSFYTKDENGAYTKRNVINAVEGGEVYTTIEESGWHYFSCDISDYDSVQIKTAFIEILSQHCSANALYQTVGSPHGMSAIYVDDVTVDYSEAADDREAPIYGDITLLAGGTETALKKREMPTTSNSIVTVKAAVAENMAKTNATGLNGKSAKAYVDGMPAEVAYADGIMTVQNVALADGAHRVKFEISDNAGNTAVAIRVINVASGVAASTIEVVPADPGLDRLYGGSVYWMDLKATRIETIQKVSFDIDLNAVNHWELDHMELAEGFSATYTVDEKTNTASITITRTGDSTQSGKQTLASLPIRVIYFDTDIALEGYTAETFWKNYNFWPEDVAVDVDRGVIEYVDGYTNNVRNTFSSREYSIDTEMYTSGQHMDPAYKAEKGTAHVHTVKTLEDTKPTCTEGGYVGRTYCEVCNSVVNWGTKQAAAGHKYAEKDGVVRCSVCGEKLNGIWNGKTYFDGILANGWADSTYYYVNGVKVTGHQVITGRMFTFGEDGVLDPTYSYTDFYETADGKLMYFVNNEAHTGYQYLNGKAYYFDDNGIGLEGQHVMAGETCLFEKGLYVSCSTADIVSGGMIGPDATYVLYSDGTLKIGGTGETYDFANHGARPYSGIEWMITKLKVGKNITSLGDNLMMNSSVSEVVFEEGSELRRIGKRAFMQCYKLTEIELPNKVTALDREAFSRSTNLKKAVLPISVRSIDPSAFLEWKNLTLYVVNGSYSLDYAKQYQIPYVTDKADKEDMNGLLMINGELWFYKDGSPYYAGLIEIDGDYYYINSSCKAVTGEYYVNKNNGLMESDMYTFDENGRMVIAKNGIVEEDGVKYYYENGKKVYAGLTQINGDYYYVNKDGKVITGDYYVEKTNNLMEKGIYSFDENGRMIRSNRSVPMYRMYDPNSGEHFYTGAEAERDFLVSFGWQYEGVGFNFPEEGAPVYRLYEPVYGEHLYTMDEAEKDKLLSWGWNYEGVAFNSAGTDEVAQYRLRNPNAKRGAYHFTGSAEERDRLVSFGWVYEGIGWYSCVE